MGKLTEMSVSVAILWSGQTHRDVCVCCYPLVWTPPPPTSSSDLQIQFVENPRLGMQAKVPSVKKSSSAAHQTLYEKSFVLGSWDLVFGTAFLHTSVKAILLTALNTILRIFFSLCLTNRQSGASHLPTPTRFLIGAVIERHLLSGVVSKSDGLSSFCEARSKVR